MAEDDNDNFPLFDDGLPCKKAADSNQRNHPGATIDRHLLDLYQHIKNLQSNLLGHGMFSVEEKAHTTNY